MAFFFNYPNNEHFLVKCPSELLESPSRLVKRSWLKSPGEDAK